MRYLKTEYGSIQGIVNYYIKYKHDLSETYARARLQQESLIISCLGYRFTIQNVSVCERDDRCFVFIKEDGNAECLSTLLTGNRCDPDIKFQVLETALGAIIISPIQNTPSFASPFTLLKRYTVA